MEAVTFIDHPISTPVTHVRGSAFAHPAPSSHDVSNGYAPFGLVGNSAATNLVRTAIGRLAPLKGPLLITGETGTGKELIAQALHNYSKRSGKPFVAVNCASFTPSLLEDTLFGHERGAFTGASGTHRGVFEQASDGTLFLDEIGELPLAQQAALLRVLDHCSISRIGSEAATAVNVRLVAATNRDLGEMVNAKQFREDLYHRLGSLKIHAPPLRDRPEDIAPLALHFLALMEDEIGRRRLSVCARQQLLGHLWPGNARELRNTLYRAAAMTDREELQAEDIVCEPPHSPVRRVPFKLSQIPRGQLYDVLDEHGGNISRTAKKLGVPRSSLRDYLKRLEANKTNTAAGEPPPGPHDSSHLFE